MAQFRPFAIWDGISALPSGINQSQYILIGVDNQNYNNLGGFTWWAGPDESLGYVIAYYDPTFTHPNPLEIPAGIGFLRSEELTDASFLSVFNYLMGKLGQPTLSNANNAKAWLLANGYWTSYGESAWIYGDSGATPPPTPSSPSINQTLYWTGGNPISVPTQFAISANNTNQFSQIQSIFVNEIAADSNGNPAGNQATFLMGLPAGTLIEITNTAFPTQNVIVSITSVTQLTSTSYSINATYVSGSAMSGTQLYEFNFYSPNQNSGGGIGEWYFYSDEGTLNAMAPENDGNAIFLINAGGNTETFNPNLASTLYFNIDDASGASHLTEFQNLVTYGGTFTMFQNGDAFEFSAAPNSNGFFVYTTPTSGWFQINIPNGVIGQPANATFTYLDPITISISI